VRTVAGELEDNQTGIINLMMEGKANFIPE